MTQLTAAARLDPRPVREAARPSRPRLRVVHSAPLPATHMGYGMLCAALALGGLLLMLVLNTARAEGSFELGSLQSTTSELSARQVSLQSELATRRAPDSLAAQATDLGLVPSPSTAVLRLSDAHVLGVAGGTQAGRAFTVELPAPVREGAPVRIGTRDGGRAGG